MAVLQQPVASGNVFQELIGDDLAPAGTYVATVIDIRDEFGVQRTRFQSTEIETVDLTTFLFGFRDAQGYEHRVSSRRMKISGNEKAALFLFLKCLLGRAPQYGWDYMACKGAQCLVTVEQITKRDGSDAFAAIAALSPVPAGFGAPAPQAALVAGVRAQGSGVAAGPAVPPYPTAVRPVVVPVAERPMAVPVGSLRPVAPAPVAAPGGNDPLPF